MSRWTQAAASEFNALAKAEISRLRSRYPGEYFTHRGCEVIALDSKGERYEAMDSPDYLDMRQVNGKQIGQIIANFHDYAQRLGANDFAGVCLQGGVDGYESFYTFTQWPDDYEPMVGEYACDITFKEVA